VATRSDDQARSGQSPENISSGATSTGAGPERYWRIDQVAARTGLTKRTLRYYEEIGLLEPATRTEGGYRLYNEADIEHLERIKRLRDLLGFSLAEIREIAEAEEQREQVRVAWQRETNPQARSAWLDRSEELTQRQLRLIEEKLTGLQEMQSSLLARLERIDARRAELADQLGNTGGAQPQTPEQG
jgi:MerR family transcriptional regulator, repressor of the yfmOP operon